MRKILRSGIFHTLALIITALYVVPLASIFLVALAPADRELQFGIPDEFAWSNFAEAMRAENFPLFFASRVLGLDGTSGSFMCDGWLCACEDADPGQEDHHARPHCAHHCSARSHDGSALRYRHARALRGR